MLHFNVEYFFRNVNVSDIWYWIKCLLFVTYKCLKSKNAEVKYVYFSWPWIFFKYL